jgi:hypothetical protein
MRSAHESEPVRTVCRGAGPRSGSASGWLPQPVGQGAAGAAAPPGTATAGGTGVGELDGVWMAEVGAAVAGAAVEPARVEPD